MSDDRRLASPAALLVRSTGKVCLPTAIRLRPPNLSRTFASGDRQLTTALWELTTLPFWHLTTRAVLLQQLARHHVNILSDSYFPESGRWRCLCRCPYRAFFSPQRRKLQLVQFSVHGWSAKNGSKPTHGHSKDDDDGRRLDDPRDPGAGRGCHCKQDDIVGKRHAIMLVTLPDSL
jgi:hypothetical protein